MSEIDDLFDGTNARLGQAPQKKGRDWTSLLINLLPVIGAGVGAATGGGPGALIGGKMGLGISGQERDRRWRSDQLDRQGSRDSTMAALAAQRILDSRKQHAETLEERKRPVPGRDVPLPSDVFSQKKELDARQPVPGTDVPLPPDVLAQRKELGARKPVPGIDVPMAPDVLAQKKELVRGRGLQRAELEGDDGKPFMANYNPMTGKFSTIEGSEIKNPKPWKTAFQEASPTAIITSENDDGDAVYKVVPKVPGAEYRAGPTADMRNKKFARERVGASVDEVKKYGDRIISKVGPAQRIDALQRGAAAVFGNDPEFRVYQDARRALAGNLAVAQQGSRPSDVDIERVWVPMVPDPYTDTAESSRMKWNMVRTMSGLKKVDKTGAPAGGGGGSATPKRGDTKKFPNGNVGVWDGEDWVPKGK